MSQRKRQEPNSRFEQFWKIYPRHEVKVNARKAFEKINPNDDMLRHMLTWIEQAKYSKQWQDPDFIPHPATWLRRRQWQDDLPPMPKRDTVGESLISEESWNSEEFKKAVISKAKAFDF